MRTTTNVPSRRPFATVAAALAALAIASLGLAACGGSSGSSSNGASASNAATGTAAVRNPAVRNPAVRNGTVRNGAVHSEAEAKALRAFRRQAHAAKGSAAARPRFAGPGAMRFRQALAKFAACLRQNGVNVPGPNSSGRGPLFSTKGVNTASPQFKAATAKCRATLTSALRGRP